MSELFASLPQAPSTPHVRRSILGGVAGLLIAIVSIVIWSTTSYGMDRLALALCPLGIFFWSAEMDESTGLLWFATIGICVSNMLLYAGYACAISVCTNAVQNLFERLDQSKKNKENSHLSQ